MRTLRSYGLRPRDRVARIKLLGVKPPNPLPVHLVQRLGYFRIHEISTSLDPDEILEHLVELRPDVLMGYPGITALTAQLALERGLHLPIKWVTIGGETSTALMKKHIREGFQAPIFEQYGCHEVTVVAFQCTRSEVLHLCEDNCIFEIMNGDRVCKEGEEGEIVLTGLHSFVQPFIRFKLGDLVVKGNSDCACGLPFAAIESVRGRLEDRFVTPDRASVSPDDIFLEIEKRAPWVRQYQVHQLEMTRFVLRLVPDRPPSDQEVEDVVHGVQRILGNSIHVSLELPSEIPVGPSGKLRLAHSEVASYHDLERSRQPG
jgi:phenylacetate-CoA ligase